MRHLTDEELWEMIDGLASTPEKALRETHLSACPACHTRHQTLLTVNAQLSQLPLETPSAMFTHNIAAQWAAESQSALAPVALQKKRSRTIPLVFSALLAFLSLIILVLAYQLAHQYPSALPTVPGVAEALYASGKVLASKSVLNGLLLANALLLLWFFNQRVLAPFFKNRMAAVQP
jgi:anti-sigma factor RsiW